jgi:hypothetical protein
MRPLSPWRISRFAHETKRNSYIILGLRLRRSLLNVRQIRHSCRRICCLLYVNNRFPPYKVQYVTSWETVNVWQACLSWSCFSTRELVTLYQEQTFVKHVNTLKQSNDVRDFLAVSSKLCSFVWRHCLVQLVIMITAHVRTSSIFRLAVFMYWTVRCQ